MMMLVADIFQTRERVLGMEVWIRNLSWLVPVPELGAQHSSRKIHFSEKGKESLNGCC